MPHEYLKKTKLYQLAKSLISDASFPKMKSMDYSFYNGSEWLSGFGYQISVLHGGRWVCIHHVEESADGTRIHTSDIYANPDQNGQFTYHSHSPASSFSDKLASAQVRAMTSNVKRNESQRLAPAHDHAH